MTTTKPLKYSKIFIILCNKIEKAHKNLLYHTVWLFHEQQLESLVILMYTFAFFFYKKKVEGCEPADFFGERKQSGL